MKYMSLFSGIEAATVAWHPLGWEPIAFSEVDKFPNAVLQHHYPDVPNLGDVTQHHTWSNEYDPDIIVGGSPCQAFSVAGLRRGLDDERGNLTLTYLSVVDQYRPQWVVWENVPGVLSIDGGRVFGAFLGALGELGYGVAYRVLDAQYFGVPQRRRRVFVVGCLGSWTRAAQVLFEPESLRGNPPPRRTTRQTTPYPVAPGLTSSGPPFSRTGNERIEHQAIIPEPRVAPCIDANVDRKWGSNQRAEVTMQDTAALNSGGGKPGQGYPAVALHIRQDPITEEDTALPVEAKGPSGVFRLSGYGQYQEGMGTLRANGGDYGGGSETLAADQMHVRRLTPTECERLQGFPDGYTQIPYKAGRYNPEKYSADTCPDGPRYKALGNSMAVPVMHWIGKRINDL